MPITGAGAVFDAWFYLFLCPQSLSFLIRSVWQYNWLAVPNATRQITLKVTMRSQYTALIVKILLILGVSTLLLARSAGHFVFTMVATPIDDSDYVLRIPGVPESDQTKTCKRVVVIAYVYLSWIKAEFGHISG